MSDSFTLQASFKTPAGTLLNVRADNGPEFEELLDVFDSYIAKIAAIEAALTAASNVGQGAGLAPAPQQPPQSGVAVAAPAGNVPTCAHGAMKYVKAGISKATGRPYNAFYACPTDRNDPNKCQSVSV